MVDLIPATFRLLSYIIVTSIEIPRTYRDSFDIAALQGGQELSYTPDADNGMGDLFSLCSPHGSQADVVDTVLNGLFDVFYGVTGHADDRVRGQEPACDVNRHVSLANVHAIRADSERNINTIVDEDRDIILVTNGLRVLGDSEELQDSSSAMCDRSERNEQAYLSGIGVLFADLDKGNASFDRLTMKSSTYARLLLPD